MESSKTFEPNSTYVKRRKFLQMGMTGVAGLALLPLGCSEITNKNECFVDYEKAEKIGQGKRIQFSAEAIALEETRFPLGVQAGNMQAGSATLWTYANDNQWKTLRVWRQDKPSVPQEIVLVYEKNLLPEEGFIHHEVKGLAPGGIYSYCFFHYNAGEGNVFTDRSMIGQFRTAIALDCLEPLTLATTACTNYKKYEEFKPLSLMSKEKVDLFLHLGDITYNDGAKTDAEYFEKWKSTFQTKGMREMLAHTGMYAVWDDHEFMDNNGLYEAENKPQIEIAKKKYFQMIPHPKLENGRFWTSFRWGKTAEFFLLDCRLERDYSTYKSDKPIYISDDQMKWLQKGLVESPCHFQVVLNSVPITRFPTIYNIVKGDRWDGFEKQREELLGFIETQKLRNVWFLSGDFHLGVVSKLEPEGPRSKRYEILCGPGGNNSFLWAGYQSGDEVLKETIAPKNQFEFFYGEPATTLLTFDPIQDTVLVVFQDETGKTLYKQALKQS